MAVHRELPGMPQPRTKLQSKRYLYAVMAGLLVLVLILYSREGNIILPVPSPGAIPQNDQQLSSPTGGDKATVGSGTTTEGEPLIDEVGLDIYPPAKETVSSPSSSSPSSSSPSPVSPLVGGSKGKGNAGTGTGTSGTSGTIGTSNKPVAADPPAPDRPQAVIIESDIVPNLVPLMLHFATILGPTWGMILFTMQDRWVEPLSPAFQRFLADGRIEVRFLPPDTDLTSSSAVSQFLTAPWLWEQLVAAQRILLFQSDSILCSKSEARVEDYFAYDLVGAPILSTYGAGYNGGLSIRNPRLFLQVIRETDFLSSGQKFEDQFFYDELRKRGANLPAEDVAKTFSVETVYYETPLGYHQPQRWQAQHMPAIEEWCPEVKMLIGRRAE